MGKGVVLAAAADVWRSQGRRVFAVAVAGATAQRPAADMGAGVVATTLDGLVMRLQHGRLKLRPEDVIAIGEAGMVDTRPWAKIAAAAGDTGQPLRRGETADALAAYAGHGHLSVSATRSDALGAAVEQWDVDGRGGLIITDASNAERHHPAVPSGAIHRAEAGGCAAPALPVRSEGEESVFPLA